MENIKRENEKTRKSPNPERINLSNENIENMVNRDKLIDRKKMMCFPDKYSAIIDDLYSKRNSLNNESCRIAESFIVNIDMFTNAEKEFLANRGICVQDLSTRWQWVYLYPHLVYDFYKEVLYPHYNRVPTQQELNQMEYRGFLNALNEIGLSISALAKFFGHTPNREIKYAGKPYEELVELFKNIIYPNLKKKYSLADGIPPLYDHLEHDYRGLLARLSDLNRTFNDLIKSAGFTTRKDTKYKSFENFQNFVDFFDKTIYPVLKKKFSLREGEAPTVYQIRCYFSGFMARLYKNHYSINNIFTKLGLRLNYKFNYDGKSYSELKELFINIILPDLEEKYDLDLVPLYNELASVYSGFIEALGRFGKTYNQFLLDLGFEPRIVRESSLGRLSHKVLKYFISKCINNSSHRYYYHSESKIFLGASFTIDGFVFVNNNFLSEFNSNFATSYNYKKTDQNSEIINFLRKKIIKFLYLLFEYSAGFLNKDNKLNLELISRKILKYRKNINSFLFLVSTNWHSPDLFQSLPAEIENRGNIVNTKNVLLISPILFSFIIGLNSKEIEILKQILYCNDLIKLNQILQSFKNDKEIKIISKNDLFSVNGDRNLDNWL